MIPILAGDTPFPPVDQALAEPNGLLAAGGDLSVPRLLDAYARGIFPWFSPGGPILWWSPDPRMVFDTGAMHLPRRLRRWLRACPWTISADRAFESVMRACAAPRAGQRGTWITHSMLEAYVRLHGLGHAHSVEVWDGGELVGGIYGVARGRMFFGESMFSRRDHASKVALLALADGLARAGFPLLDAQVSSDHLVTLGAYELPRAAFSTHIEALVARSEREGSWEEGFVVGEARSLAECHAKGAPAAPAPTSCGR
ncbi:MAG TPA: leucyl/phenylalanyl-tRNA--protein transferase [Dokdonella sp.]|uniref:leucyl/phenylalanyl-tRNA--protein transferase n=1 Tax=Dokdonella sp. TaxID=2291710 RepID=UPI0025C56025|nr:leucyl/phenylalanyl-tRNA--protein transferase [Dokdonella sp.]MBX3692568.1 leucyl/phenylalanyl-tRNA--protein transferase [Dokdonella sp.]MCW5568567.1 leucyl/phenylalanyl-tRNA--protein transferase [Dokdonella sp.]HNR92364.1 leucyl/phenylalanyl-tRNA--protein transferase [Dokdonella sp.]